MLVLVLVQVGSEIEPRAEVLVEVLIVRVLQVKGQLLQRQDSMRCNRQL